MDDPEDIARGLMKRHGNQVEAAEREHAEELQAGRDVAGYERWRSALVLCASDYLTQEAGV